MALMCLPSPIHWPLSTGSPLLLAVLMMPLVAGAVGLVPDKAERLGSRGHQVQHGVIGLAAGPRNVLPLVHSHPAQTILHGVQSHLHGQDLANLVFAQEKYRHDPWSFR